MKTFLVAAFSLALTACAGSSPRIDAARLSELEKGRTTVTEVVGRFGRPSVLSKNTDGTQTALYLHSDGPAGTTTLVPLIATTPVDSVTFYFNDNGVLTDYKTTQAKARTQSPVEPATSARTGGNQPSTPATSASSGGNQPVAPDTAARSDGKQPSKSNVNILDVPSWLPPATKENR